VLAEAPAAFGVFDIGLFDNGQTAKVVIQP
jgi:hypothetical protein